MNPHSSPMDHGPHELDSLVRDHLDQLAGRIDTGNLLKRIQNAIPPDPSDPNLSETLPTHPSHSDHGQRHSRAWRSRWSLGLLTAAAVLLAFLGGLQWSPSRASAAVILREAQKVHLLPVDRCYLVEVRYGTAWQGEEVPPPPPDRVCRLWTRGDRFWMESLQSKIPWAWGRDEKGGFWMAAGLHRGIRIERDEMPRWLESISDVQSMQLETLLNDVLTHFSIERRNPTSETEANTFLITAKPKLLPWLGGFRSITMEVDSETKVLKRVTIARILNGQPLATTTYTLLETESKPDQNFELEGHLMEPYQIFTRQNAPEKRGEFLSRVFGSQPGRWFQMQQKAKKGLNP